MYSVPSHYVLNTTSVFCDAYIEGEENESLTGNFALLFGLYLACKIVWAYCVGPSWNFIDAVATKKCQKLNVDWAWTNVAGSIGAAIAPLIVGED